MKHFPFFFYMVAHSSLMIVRPCRKRKENVSFSFLFLHGRTLFPHDCLNILLKKFKICSEIPQIQKSAPHRNPSINLHYRSIDWFESCFSRYDGHLDSIRLVFNCRWNRALHFYELSWITACYSPKGALKVH